MFNLSGSEIIVILLLALVVLGPEKLPDALRKAGKTYAELKKMSSSFQSEMRSALDEPMKEMRETADLLRKSADLGAADATSTTPATAAKTPAAAARTPDAVATDPLETDTSAPTQDPPDSTAATADAAEAVDTTDVAAAEDPTIDPAPESRNEDGTSA